MWSEETVNAMVLALAMIGGQAVFRDGCDDHAELDTLREPIGDVSDIASTTDRTDARA
jgi:hypothetical protein